MIVKSTARGRVANAFRAVFKRHGDGERGKRWSNTAGGDKTKTDSTFSSLQKEEHREKKRRRLREREREKHQATNGVPAAKLRQLVLAGVRCCLPEWQKQDGSAGHRHKNDGRGRGRNGRADKRQTGRCNGRTKTREGKETERGRSEKEEAEWEGKTKGKSAKRWTNK
jgi:hypothetical protein